MISNVIKKYKKRNHVLYTSISLKKVKILKLPVFHLFGWSE